VTPPDDLAPARVAAALTTRRFGRAYQVLATCPSTSDEVARLAREGAAEGLVLVADSQSAGRGRMGRAWHSPPGENLYLSLLLRPSIVAGQVPPVTLLAGGVLASVLAAAGARPQLKWPNDVLLPTAAGPRKVAGILTEMATERERVRQVVLGVGLNVHGTHFPPELAERATSLRLATGMGFDRGQLLARFLNALEPAYHQFVAEGPATALARWRTHAPMGGRCRVGALEGTALDVDAEGALLVRDDAGTVHRIQSGEVESC
jgi:BirA family biotin operon repressor/biotin-[acetyl-CoA-carboxylase] ligase